MHATKFVLQPLGMGRMGSHNISFRTRREGDGIVLEIDMKKIVSFKVDDELARWVEEAWRDQGFSSRSDFLRHVIKEILDNNKKLSLMPETDFYRGASKTITFKIDKRTLEKLDMIVEEKGYYNRSDFLRDVLKKYWLDIPDGSSTLP